MESRCVWFLLGFRRFAALSRPLTVTVVTLTQTHTVATVNVHRMNGEQCGRQHTSKPTRCAGGRSATRQETLLVRDLRLPTATETRPVPVLSGVC